jgi:hypothetical protein
MKKTLIILASAIALVGCATSMESRLLKRGQLIDAYYAVVMNAYTSSSSEKDNVIDVIFSKTGGAKEENFSNLLLESIDNNPKHIRFYLEYKKIINQAYKDGLISNMQLSNLNNYLTFSIEKESIQKPDLITKEIKYNFPKVGQNIEKIALIELNNLEFNQNSELNLYIPIYQVLKESKNYESIQRIEKTIQQKSKFLLEKTTGNDSLESINPILNYIKISDDRTLDALTTDKLSKMKLTRAQISTGDISKIFPDFSKNQIASRSFFLNIKSINDDFIVDEIIHHLKNINEWIEISEESSRKITFSRIRFQENQTNPVNITQTVPNPSISTLLFIPKNASVLFDYRTTEYSLNWSINIQDSLEKRSKAFSGNKKAKRTECSNIRYQNVFGGTGAINNMPNQEVSYFCSANSNTNFDEIRKETINLIAEEINKEFLKNK